MGNFHGLNDIKGDALLRYVKVKIYSLYFPLASIRFSTFYQQSRFPIPNRLRNRRLATSK